MIYVCGGLTKSVYCYDPVSDYWMLVLHTFNKMVEASSQPNFSLCFLKQSSHICLLVSSQESCGMSVCNGKIYILGGRTENGESTDTVLCYDPSTGIITGAAAMPRPIAYHGCVTIHRYNDKYYKSWPWHATRDTHMTPKLFRYTTLTAFQL